MKIDTALKEFSEKYSREAMQSIVEISTDYGLTNEKHTIKGFDIKQAFEQFIEFVTGYAAHKISSVGEEQKYSVEAIMERTEHFIKDDLFKESPILYADFPEFGSSYLFGVDRLIERVDGLKADMMTAAVDEDSIALMNTFSDTFIEHLNESFDSVMNKMLWASGYYNKQRMAKPVTERAVFL